MRISSSDVIEGGRVLYTIGKIKARIRLARGEWRPTPSQLA